MSVLCLDLGTTTGWCLRHGGATLSGTFNLKGRRFDGGGMRFLRFRGALNEMHAATPVKLVFFEEVRAHRGVDAAHVYGGLLATLTSWCEENKIPYEGVPVSAIKKRVTGKGNADKAAVMKGVRGYGYSPTDDNEADAIGLLLAVADRSEVAPLL